MHENSLKNLRPWHQGQTGNPNGRPTARSRLTERFIADVSLTWEQHGSAVLQKMATKEPTRFADLCSRLIPRDVTLSLEARHIGGLSSEDMEIFRAIKEALPDANQRPSRRSPRIHALSLARVRCQAGDRGLIDCYTSPSFVTVRSRLVAKAGPKCGLDLAPITSATVTVGGDHGVPTSVAGEAQIGRALAVENPYPPGVVGRDAQQLAGTAMAANAANSA